VVTRRGSATSGCLSILLFAAVVLFVGIHVGAPYFRYYQYRDAATQEARFASLHTDAQIEQNLWSVADSLNLPEAAYHLRIARTGGGVRIRANYRDTWTLLRYTRTVHFVFDVSTPL